MRQIVKNSLCWKQMENPTQTGRFGYKKKMFSMQIKFPKRHFSPALFFSGGGWERVQKIIEKDLANSPQNSGFSSDCSELPLINRPSCHGPSLGLPLALLKPSSEQPSLSCSYLASPLRGSELIKFRLDFILASKQSKNVDDVKLHT